MTKPRNAQKAPRKGKATAGQPVETRQPNDGEVAAIAAAKQTHQLRPTRPAYVEVPDEAGTLRVQAPHSDEEGHAHLVAETLASTSNDFIDSCLVQLANATAEGGKPSIKQFNASLALIGAIQPQNELETALTLQMVRTHELTLEMLSRTKSATHLEALRDYGNLATKLSRTFTAQMKQLSDWRRGGEQVVRHVHVYEGGQAVVAETVNLRGSVNGTIGDQSHATAAIGGGPALLGSDPFGNGMPIPGGERAEALQDARRHEPGSAEGQ